jgi:hypothetical protein
VRWVQVQANDVGSLGGNSSCAKIRSRSSTPHLAGLPGLGASRSPGMPLSAKRRRDGPTVFGRTPISMATSSLRLRCKQAKTIWVNGTTVVASIASNFDQFAQSVKVGLFTFGIVEVAGGRDSLRYLIAERAPVNVSDARKWPLRAVRR